MLDMSHLRITDAAHTAARFPDPPGPQTSSAVGRLVHAFRTALERPARPTHVRQARQFQ